MKQQIQEKNYNYYMSTDISLYSGEWIEICENKIVAHGRNLKNVVKEANEKCFGKKFLLARAPGEEAMIF